MGNIMAKLHELSEINIRTQPSLKAFLAQHGIKWSSMLDSDMTGAINHSSNGPISRKRFEAWQSLMINVVLSPLEAGFEDMLPQNMLNTYYKLMTISIDELEQILSRFRDIMFRQEIGMLENIGWNYLQDISKAEKEVEKILATDNDSFTFYDLLLLAYWNRNGGTGER